MTNEHLGGGEKKTIPAKSGIKNKATASEESGSSKRKKIPKRRLAQAAFNNE